MSDIDSVLVQVRRVLADRTPAQRVAMLREWFAGYCTACGKPLKVVCDCQDAKAVPS